MMKTAIRKFCTSERWEVFLDLEVLAGRTDVGVASGHLCLRVDLSALSSLFFGQLGEDCGNAAQGAPGLCAGRGLGPLASR